MNDKQEKTIRHKLFIFAIPVIALLVCLKSVITDFGFDQAYTVAMSYRHLNGDRMLTEMWDPLQPSIFVADILMFIYRIFVPSFTGVSIYLGICGTLLFVLAGILLYKEIKDVSNEFAAFLAAVFFLVFRAKMSLFPDYTSLSVFFSAMTFVFLVKFFKNGEKCVYLILSACLLCLQVLAYPSTALVFVGMLITLLTYSKRKGLSCLVLTGTCALAGGFYVGYFVIRLGFDRFWATLQYIVSGDAHGGDYEGQLNRLDSIRSGQFFRLFLMQVLLALSIAVLLLLVKLLLKHLLKREVSILLPYTMILFLFEMVYMVFWKHGLPEWFDFGYTTALFLTVIAAANFKNLNAEQRRFFISGIAVSCCTFLAACLLTNMPLLYVFPYLALAGTVSFAAISDNKKRTAVLVTVLAMALFKTGFYIEGYAQVGKENTIALINVHNRTLTGPNAQLISTSGVAYQERVAEMEFREQIRRDDNALYVGGVIIDPILYLAMDAGISNPNTTNTPFYSETLERYYEMNPHKYPTVIVVEVSPERIPYAGEDSWVMNWIKSEGFNRCAQGEYWAYYRKD